MRLLLSLSLFFLSLTANGAQPARGLNEEERVLLTSVLKNCRGSEAFLNDVITETEPGVIATAGMSSGSAADSMKYTHTVSPTFWQVIVAAAKKLKERNWIVTDHEYSIASIKDRVVSQEQYDKVKAENERILCVIMDRVPTCTKATSRVALETIGVELNGCGDQKPWDKIQKNAIRPQYQTMITSLLELGYTYDAASGEFNDPVPDRSSDYLEFGVDANGGAAYR